MERLKIKRMEKRQDLRGVLTVELAYIFMIIFSIFVLVIHTVFYYHDKNILSGAASETAVLWAQLERNPAEEGKKAPEEFFQERILGKLIFFPGASVTVNKSDEQVEVIAYAQNRAMSVEVCGKSVIVDPEEKIRKKRIVEEWTKQEE